MLYDYYSAEKLGRPNNSDLQEATDSDLTLTAMWFTMPTDDPEIFSTYSPWELREFFDDQEEQMLEELAVLQKYKLITAKEADRTKKQYKKRFFHNWYAFLKEYLITPEEIKKKNIQAIYSKQEQEQYEQPQPQSKPKKFSIDPVEQEDDDPFNSMDDYIRSIKEDKLPSWTIGISTRTIREITWYSYTVQKQWHQMPVDIPWQKEFIESPHNIIVVDGSRQWGKSLTVAEKVIEESFIPGKDMMIAAFLQETTESIGDYMIDYIEKFEDGTFTIKERKRYIQNNESGVRIHFRTLKDWAKGIRGKTLRLIVVDEAMLVPTSVFKSVLLPTQTTIENPKLILLGTASDNTSCYMYKTITNIKKGLVYNNPGQKTAIHIRFSVLENPLVSPIMKQEILDDQNSPDTQREYFNKWWKLDDSLFQAKRKSLAEISDQLSQQAHIILAIDPARKRDRSAYVFWHCLNWRLVILSSGEVPHQYKSDWSLQGKFFIDLYNKHSSFHSRSASIDVTGVGDWVIKIFRDMWLPISDGIRYTAGDTDSKQGEGQFVVGKSLMINNVIDMLQEDTLIIPFETNTLLLEEMEFIQMSQTKMWKISFVSDFFDDITNAMMICAYSAKKNNYLSRVSITNSSTMTLEKEHDLAYKPRHPRWARQEEATSW